MTDFSEAEWESIALETLGRQEWLPLNGSQIGSGTENGRTSWDDLVLPNRMLARMRALNPDVPAEYIEQARAAILQPSSQDAITENYRLHEYLVNGYRGISYIDSDGIEQNPTIRLISHRREENELLAVQQVTIRSTEHDRRFDIVAYLNGLPIALFELKQAGSKNADLPDAHAQFATYLREFPMAFRFAILNVISDGITARYGTPFTPLEHFAPWNVDDDGKQVTFGQAVDDLTSGHRTRIPHRRPVQPRAVSSVAEEFYGVRFRRRRSRHANCEAAPILCRHQGRRIDGHRRREQR